jgi:hypothetical protein
MSHDPGYDKTIVALFFPLMELNSFAFAGIKAVKG